MRWKVPGVFCLEGDWWTDFNRTSTVKPVLDLFGSGMSASVPSVHRDVCTRAEFEYYCRKWRQKGNARYPILYLAFHGGPACIYVGDGRRQDATVTLDALGELLGSGPGNRMVHFGACETFDTDRRNLKRFLRNTGVVAISGFKKSVDWMESAAFEILFFEALLRYTLTATGMKAVERSLKREYGGLARRLDFRMEIRESGRGG